MEDHYGTLELTREAAQGEIRKAFTRLALVFHPDKNPHGSQRFVLIKAAYEVLSNVRDKATYDRKYDKNHKSGRKTRKQKAKRARSPARKDEKPKFNYNGSWKRVGQEPSEAEIRRGRSKTGFLFADNLEQGDEYRAVQQNDHDDPIRMGMMARGTWVWPIPQQWQKLMAQDKRESEFEAYEEAFAAAHWNSEKYGTRLVLPQVPVGYNG